MDMKVTILLIQKPYNQRFACSLASLIKTNISGTYRPFSSELSGISVILSETIDQERGL